VSSSRRKAVDTSLFRPKEEIDKDNEILPIDADMSLYAPRKRASFDIRPDQVSSLGQLKYKTGKKISDLVVEALDDLLAKYS
jgi:hypothetical protein